jgi:acyl transferase domain-containing protein/acyl carrier protein
VAGFDAAFFGISPREALAMDPQQRLALEVTWEALEHAGINPLNLRGSDTAVFTGANQQQYGPALHESPHDVAGHRLTGTAGSVISGRVAYLLGLSGAAVTVDTACSSSLVAIHLACQALRQRETSLALAGGVTVLSTPGTIIEFDRLGGLAPDGRCKSFAATANGTGLAEGAGVLVLERLSDARRSGHRVWGLLRGSAVNQDGLSNGLSAPSGPAQQRVIQQALISAGLSARDVDVVEAHGTGTALGDPIEANAVLATYGRDRPQGDVLWLGSLKSNIGHAQAAAGVAGVIKMVMAMDRGTLPRTLHADRPTPHVDWSAGTVQLLSTAQPWPSGPDRLRRAAVSSFGISGTNAHVILEQAAPESQTQPTEPTRAVWLLSGRSGQALRAQAERLRAHVRQHPDLTDADLACSLAVTRASWEHRAGLLGRNRVELLDQLDALAADRDHPGLLRGVARAGGLAFLFSGQGSQRSGMGAESDRAFPVFRQALQAVCAELDPLLGLSLRSLMFSTADGEKLNRTEFAQPALFALQVAQFWLLSSWGLHPEVLVGHSVGEVAAAHVSGVLSLSDAARLVAARGKLMQALPDGGAMIAVQADADTVRALLHGHSDRAAIAAVNGARSVVLSGPEQVVTNLAAQLHAQGHRWRRLAVSHAFHSPLLEPMLDQLHAVASNLNFRPARIPIISTLTGQPDGLDTPRYWVRQARETVRFAEAIHTTVRRLAVTTLLEIGPDATLSTLVRMEEPDGVLALSTSRADRAEPDTLVEAAARLHVHGRSPLWHEVLPGRRAPLPTYAFQHERFWMGTADEPPSTTVVMSSNRQRWLTDHVVGGTILLPGTEFLRLALNAAASAGYPHVAELVLREPLDLSGGRQVTLRIRIGPASGHNRPLWIDSQPESGGRWTCHAEGTLSQQEHASVVAGWSTQDADRLDISRHYWDCARRGIDFGPTFQGLAGVWRDGEYLLSETTAVPDTQEAPFHPATLDAALQALLVGADGPPPLPLAWSGVRLHRSAPGALRARISRTDPNTVGVAVFDEQGRLALTVAALTLRPAKTGRQVNQPELARLVWRPTDPGPVVPDTHILLGEAHPALPDALTHPTLESFLDHVARTPAPDTVVVHLASPTTAAAAELPAAIRHTARDHLQVLSSLLTHPHLTNTHLTLLTHDASADDPDLTAATIRGLWRSASTEHPDRITLLDTDDDAATHAALPYALSIRQHDLRLDHGIPHVPARQAVSGDPTRVPLDSEGTVLITGGTGALGALLARHFATRYGVKHLVLTSRRGLAAPGAPQLRAELGATITAHDLTDPEQVADLLAGIPAEQPLTAIVHAAGTVRDATITGLTPDHLDTVLRPKIDAAWHLHQQTQHMNLSLFCLYSSLAGVLGTAGQGNYAAGNAFLAALARHRSSQGRTGLAIAWGWWDNTGLTAQLTSIDRHRFRGHGLMPMSADEGLAMFDAAISQSEPLVIAARFGTEPSSPATNRAADTASRLHARLASQPDAAERTLIDLVRGHVAMALGYPNAEPVAEDAEFVTLGMDSLTAVELRNALSAATGLSLPLRELLQHATSRDVAGYLRAELDGWATHDKP